MLNKKIFLHGLCHCTDLGEETLTCILYVKLVVCDRTILTLEDQREGNDFFRCNRS